MKGKGQNAREMVKITIMSNDELRKLKYERDTVEGKLDKNGNPLKLSRDTESDWTVIDRTPSHVTFGVGHRGTFLFGLNSGGGNRNGEGKIRIYDPHWCAY